MHLKYLDQHLDDYIDGNVELTPSFVQSQKAYQHSTEQKVLETVLIKEQEILKASQALEAKRQKNSSNIQVQSRGVLIKGIGIEQIKHKRKSFWQEKDLAKNMAQNYRIKKYNNIWTKLLGQLKHPREGQKIKTTSNYSVEPLKSGFYMHYTRVTAYRHNYTA